METFEFETCFVDERGAVVAWETRRAERLIVPAGGGISLALIRVPDGIFQMGSPGHRGYPDERPLHPVRVPGFYLGQFPVTQAQWRAAMGRDLPYRSPGEQNPVDRVSWRQALDFCRRLAGITGLPFRLPSEAEWEFACRAGTATPFAYGPTLTTDLANYCGEHIFALEPRGLYRHTSTPVGSFPPNGLGLADMHGNLWEWCADSWHEDYTGAPVDAAAWETPLSPDRVVRGGSWHEPPGNCRSATRLRARASEAEDLIGFRVALSAGG